MHLKSSNWYNVDTKSEPNLNNYNIPVEYKIDQHI